MDTTSTPQHLRQPLLLKRAGRIRELPLTYCRTLDSRCTLKRTRPNLQCSSRTTRPTKPAVLSPKLEATSQKLANPAASSPTTTSRGRSISHKGAITRVTSHRQARAKTQSQVQRSPPRTLMASTSHKSVIGSSF